MKKIGILICSIFLLTGCYDYQELKDLAIVSGIALDYQDEEFVVEMEILNNKKHKDNESDDKTYYVKGKGSTVAQAIYASTIEVAKSPYYPHLKVVLLSNEILENHMKEMLDFFLRQATNGNDFYIIGAIKTDPFTILETVNKSEPVASLAISNLLKDNKEKKSLGLKKTLQNYIEESEGNGIDAIIPSVTLEDDRITLSNFIAFHGQKKQFVLTETESQGYSLLKKQDTNMLFESRETEEKIISINILNDGKSKILCESNACKISGSFYAQIIENTTDIDLRDVSSYETIKKIFLPQLEEVLNQLLQTITQEDTDILGVGQAYYKTYRTYPTSWKDLHLSLDIDLVINKNGLIFEVES